MKRRDFIKYGAGGLTALAVGAKMPWLMNNPAYAAVTVPAVNLTITDAMKNMVTNNSINSAQCYFWVYKSNVPDLPADCPGPIIFCCAGWPIKFTVTNNLDEPHALSIPALKFTTGPIKPGGTVTRQFIPPTAGTYLYYDDLNAPVNRVMGLHGAFIVMPRVLTGTPTKRVTPYSSPGKNVQQLFNDLGTAPWWPGLAWEEGDPATDTPGFRQNIWVLHQASPHLFAEVGNYTAGLDYPADQFVQKFLKDPFSPTRNNNVPQYFTISGQSGHFAHNSPWICPYSRVGEPYLIRILNAGLWLHSTHIHANHVFVLSHNNKFDPFPGSVDNPIWVDVYTANPLDTYDWLIPYMRPPDVPNDLGIGRDDLQQSLDVSLTSVPMGGYGIANPGGPLPFLPADILANPPNPWVPGTHLTWPPLQEMETFIPNVGQRMAKAQDGVTDIDCAVRLSPVCFPMHDHSEPSQVAQGGNYNCGLISGIVFTGDRKGGKVGQVAKVMTFPDRPTTGDPATPVAHGPDYYDATVQPPAKEFKMPSIP